jgi:hypothetical protein
LKYLYLPILLCLLFTNLSFGQGVEPDGYKIYKSSVSNEQGDIFVTVPVSNCSAVNDCNGFDTLGLNPSDLFQLCWDGYLVKRCETGPLIVTVPGTYFFKVYSYTEAYEVTYDRYNPDTQEFEETTYTMPEYTNHQGSKEAILIVGNLPPDPPINCTIRKYLP